MRSPAPYRIVPLPRKLDRKAFVCGNEKLDAYFQRQVGQDIDKGFATCFVALDAADSIAGFYTLASYSIAVDLVPDDIRRKLPRYDVIPCTLMGRLAVATHLAKQGLGSAMLMHALRKAQKSDVGTFAMVVDAKDDEALAFYLKHGFAAWHVETPLRCFLPLHTGMVTVAPPDAPAPAEGIKTPSLPEGGSSSA